ncbi:MAG: glycogen/starch/alpha-glucan family phosphorylase, partial [Ruminococcus sp.]|nr:glycogen/starch/alpha-glucan family phosphorylase [Ruminococcus sp.]
KYGNDFSHFSEHAAIQLNDTHPVCCIPELIRLLGLEGISFEEAFQIAQKTFAYTNHTVMAEALEKWDIYLMRNVIPEVYHIIELINERLWNDFKGRGMTDDVIRRMCILSDDRVHMARLAIYGSSYVNGVAWIHTEILKNDVLNDWYKIYPERFQNKTNGITQRRWLGLCNPELSSFITERVGDGWQRDMAKVDKLAQCIDKDAVKAFNKIKATKKKQLAAYVKKMEGKEINPKFIFDVQVKRLHEYKRQLLNAFSIMWIYFMIKDGKLPDFEPTCFIFGAKAAPGYRRAKAIIKYINEIADLVNNDPDTKDKLQVIFVSNYNVSYAEKIVVAADVSEQISTAGTEASGTGNMKFMFNGAVTLGTYDGANVEITQAAGEENEYIFGGRVEDIENLKRNGYDPKAIYMTNPMLKRVVDTLVDGTFDDDGAQGEGSFAELHNALVNGTHWHIADHYFLFYDLPMYVEAKLQVNRDYKDKMLFGTKCLENIAHCSQFSSDRTILQYAKELWMVK